MLKSHNIARNKNGLRVNFVLPLALANYVLCFGLSGGRAYGQEPVAPAAGAPAVITVSGNRLLRDGELWVPHALQLAAFVAPPAAQKPPFIGAYKHYSLAELRAMKDWGADSIRFQVSQPGADPHNPLYDPAFIDQVVGAVKAARAIGLNVIVSIQDEEQSGEQNSPAVLPNAATNRVWHNLAPMLNGDDGIIYEMINEPEPLPNPADWERWAKTMNGVIRTIRATGATNTLLADGLNFAESLHGAIALDDPLQKVFYSTHPYFHNPEGQKRTTWIKKFGEIAAKAPVIVGEWTTPTISNYYCQSDTPEAARRFLHYINSLHIGLVAANYDFGLPKFGGVVSDYSGTPTTFSNGIQCGTPGFGPGRLIQSWYRTGSVPDHLE